MKKTSIIAIVLIYMVAIIVVGFLGVKMQVDNPIIYAEKIVWNSSDLEKNTKFKIEKDKTVLESEGLDTDAKLQYSTLMLTEPLKINIKCYVEPANATNTKLDYYFDSTGIEDSVSIEIKGDNTADITFVKAASFTLFVKSTDGKNITYKIRINIVDLSEFM